MLFFFLSSVSSFYSYQEESEKDEPNEIDVTAEMKDKKVRTISKILFRFYMLKHTSRFVYSTVHNKFYPHYNSIRHFPSTYYSLFRACFSLFLGFLQYFCIYIQIL